MSDDPLDDALRLRGEQWRANLDPDPDLVGFVDIARQRWPYRRPLLIAAAVLAVAAVATVVTLAIPTGQHPHGTSRQPAAERPASRTGSTNTTNSGKSCVAPILSLSRNGPVDNTHPANSTSPTRRFIVAAGGRITVHGRWYFASSCRDTGNPLITAPAAPAGSVTLTLTTSDRRSQVLAAAHPGADHTFTVSVEIPGGARAGAAVISDQLGDRVLLEITRTDMASLNSLTPAERIVALRAAHRLADREATNKHDPQIAGWPANITIVAVTANEGSGTGSNTGYQCRSGKVLDLQLIGDFNIVIAPPAAEPGVPPPDTTVHAVNATVDETTGRTCLGSVQTGNIQPTSSSTVLYRR